MIKFINKTTGSEMWVADERKEEYIEAGHKPASIPIAEKPTDKIIKRIPKKKTR